MASQEKELDRLFGLIEGHVDLEHCRAVDERSVRALAWQEVDHPPLVVQAPFGESIALPPPWDVFRRYSYREAFDNPVAMLQNELLEKVVPGVILRDDSPLAIRNNHGTIQIAAVMGAPWTMHADDYPWVEHVSSPEDIESLVARVAADESAGVLPRSFGTLRFYHRKLGEYPRCRQAIQISMPDLEGPMNTAEQIWGSDIYYAFIDRPELLRNLLARVAETMLAVSEQFRAYAVDRLDPTATTQHGCMNPGRLLIRDDASIMLSPSTYQEHVVPHHVRLLAELGGGSIHFCGNGQHLIGKMLSIPHLRGIDVGQPELMDIDTVYAACRERGVAVIRMAPAREGLIGGETRKRYPTGCVLVYLTTDIRDAAEVVREVNAAA